ncbi:MAG: DUF5947 family protein [Actinomycetota bacterium]|nr:DUF5947 family protein [Actinomycetota bacterium]
MDNGEARARAAAVEQLLASLDALADPKARERATAAVQGLCELYGEALARVLACAASVGAPALVDAMAQDELVSQLLLLHDLHPSAGGADVTDAPASPVVPPDRVLLPLQASDGDGITTRDARPLHASNVDTSAVTAPASQERCELCSEPTGPQHRHVVDLDKRELLCACRACSLLFDRPQAGGQHYRLVSDRCRYLDDLHLDDAGWAALRIPVDMAFFIRNAESGKVTAFYPSPMGATESLLELDAWAELENANPILSEMEPDVEALLVNRSGGAREHWLIGVDECYRLIGLVRREWKGFSGGQECWEAIGKFFADLRVRVGAVTV